MIIKIVRTFTKEISKEELKKRSMQIGIVSLGLFLTLKIGFMEQKNTNDYSEIFAQYERNLQEVYTLSSCKVLIENCPDGKIKHHLVSKNSSLNFISCEENAKYSKFNYEYVSLTDPTFVVPYFDISYKADGFYCFAGIPETSDYIFDYKAKYYVMDIKNISLPDGYSLDDLYSVDELTQFERSLDTSWFLAKDLNTKEYFLSFPFKNLNKTYFISDLCLLEIEGEYIFLDKTQIMSVAVTTNLEDVTKLRNVYFVQDIVNPFVEVKLTTGMNQIEERMARNMGDYSYLSSLSIEEITSLNKNMSDYFVGKPVEIKNIYDYLTEEQILRGIVSYEELAHIVELRRESKLHLVL